MLEKRLILKVAVVLVMALAFCFTAMAEREKPPLPILSGSKAIGTNPMPAQEEARDIQQAIDYKNSIPQPVLPLSISRQYANDLKKSPVHTAPRPAMADKVDVLFEGFEGGIIPPTGWTVVVNNTYTWEIDTYAPFEGVYNATCLYDDTYSGDQDEWLISPVIDLGTSSWVLEFAWNGSYYWSVDPYDNCDLTVKISDDGGTTWDDLWNEDAEGVFTNWQWYEEMISLSAYSGNVQIAFVYTGYDGAQLSFDAVSVNDGAIPTGRCCYGDPASPSCIDEITEADCLATYSGRWTEGIKCDDEPCPLAPSNDTYDYAIDITGACPVNVTGTTIGATVDCPGVLDWNAVWYKFTVPYDYNRVDIDYCGTAIPVQCVGVVLYAEPVDCASYILYDNANWDDCGDENPSIMWMGLPAGTYYFPVYIGDADCLLSLEQDFQFTYCVSEIVPPENDDADKAEEIGEVTDLPFSTTLATFDGPGGCQTAPNVWFCYTATTTGLGQIDLCGSGYDTKLAVYEGCEVDGTGMPLGAQLGCNDDDSNGGGNVCSGKTLQSAVLLEVVAGNSYLIEVGGYSANVGDGDLSITVIVGGVCCDPLTGNCTDVADEATCLAAGGNYHAGEECASYTCPPPASEGDNCDDPVKVDIPGDLPYQDLSQYTCGRWNDYINTQMCYTSYGNGEDIVYELTVTASTTIEITIDPKGTTWTYCQIAVECPPVASTCVYYFRNTGGTAYSSDPVVLAPGTYYMIVDTWPSPDCIPDYDITLDVYEACDLDCPSGGIAEAEACGDDTNGGCSSDPPTEQFEAITPGTTVCGTCWADTELRDLDWYEFVTTESGDITWTGQGEFPTYMWILNAEGGCDGATVLASAGADPCTPITLTTYVAPGTYWLLVAPSDWLDIQCGGGGAYGPEYFATFTFEPGVSYCAASGGCDEYISNVTVGTINNSSACTGYADYTALSTTMEVGVGYPFSMTVGNAYSSDYGAVWVDWNQDMDFDDVNESIVLDVNYGVGPYTGTITPPGDALPGPTRMRVRLSYYSLPPACGATSYGEAEDYTITIGGGIEYCEASGGCDEFIENVTIGTINNTSDCDEYADYTALTTDVGTGGGYPISITVGNSYSADKGAVWVDWNVDGDFDDANEAITLAVSSGYGPYTGTINVPGDAPLGPTRMRVRVSYSTYPPACGVTTYGEAEDYTLNVVSIVIEPVLAIDPETMHYADGELVVDEDVTIWMGGNQLGFDVNDIEQATVTVNGVAPLAMEIGTHPDMTGDVLVITMSKIAFVQSYGLIWTGDPYTFTVAGDYTGGSFSETEDITLIGHIPGDVDKNGVVNVIDIILMINAKYKGGAAINPIQLADVNADGTFNVLDIVRMIDFKFKGGPAPIHP